MISAGAAQPCLRLRRACRCTASEPREFLAGQDLAGRLLLGLAFDAFGARLQVRRVGARPGSGVVDEAATAVELDHPARPDGGGEPVEGVAIVGHEHERRFHGDQPGLEPFDRFEVEMVRRLVEHDHVVIAVFVVGRAPWPARPAWPARRTARSSPGRTAAARRARSPSQRPPSRRRGRRRPCPAGRTGSCSSEAIRTPRPKRTSPVSGRSAPVRIRSSVVFPDPLTPTIATRSPVEIVRSMPANSSLSGWLMPTPATSTQITPRRYGPDTGIRSMPTDRLRPPICAAHRCSTCG